MDKVIGATGPAGPAGPATITVGTTITGAPGTPATVTNVGTNENAILNFTIPQGVTGPTGETGPTGAQGEIGPTGPAATFTVNPTVTGEPGTDANVVLGGTDGAYTLTFTIPQGPTGPTGNGLAAYGGLYAAPNQTLALTDGGTAYEIVLANPMTLENVQAANR